MKVQVAIGTMSICTASGSVIGTFTHSPSAGEVVYAQRCPLEDCPGRFDISHVRDLALPTPGGDIPRRVELCHCCAQALINSGSRWNVLYCEDCRGRVWDLARRTGFAVIPLGRHGTMNGIAPDGYFEHSLAFRSCGGNLSQRMRRMREWRCVLIAELAEDMGAGGSPALDLERYLAHAAGRGDSRRELFQQLCRFVGVD